MGDIFTGFMWQFIFAEIAIIGITAAVSGLCVYWYMKRKCK